MTTVDDIIRAMQERPEVRDQVRRAILTDELLELPERFAALTVRVDDLAVQTAANTKAIAELTIRLDRLTARVDELTETVRKLTAQTAASFKRIEDRLGILMGERLERKVARIGPPRISQILKLRRARIMLSTELLTYHADEFRDSVEMAEESGKITETDMARLFDTDLVLRARRRTGDRQTLWVAAEASATIRESDITRASESVDALRAAFGEDAAGVVIGHIIRDEDLARAEAKRLTVMLVELPDPDDWIERDTRT